MRFDSGLAGRSDVTGEGGVVGIDAGQTRCRLAVHSGHAIRATGTGPGFHYTTGQDPVDGIMAGVEAAWRDAGAPTPGPSTVCLGMTGPCGSGEGIDRLASAVRELMGPVPLVRITGDHVTSYVGALGLESGVALAAGTGVIALAVSEDGGLSRAGGWGYLLGDEGGGFWIGRRAIEAALRAIDRRGPPTSLVDALRANFGDPAQLHRTIYMRTDMVAVVAGFSRATADAAEAGDAVAQAIWTEAAQELAATCVAAAEKAFGTGDTFPIACIGGLLNVGPLLTEPLEQELARRLPQGSVVAASGTSLDGAVRMAAAHDLGPLRQGALDHHV